jgi:uncharacterized protein YegP (UPF0339 family)
MQRQSIFEIYHAEDGWRWHEKFNGYIISASPEAYARGAGVYALAK